jgi:hypothetical protein
MAPYSTKTGAASLYLQRLGIGRFLSSEMCGVSTAYCIVQSMACNDRHMVCHPWKLVAAGSLFLRCVSARSPPISVNESACVPPVTVVYPYYTDFVVIEVNFNDGKF